MEPSQALVLQVGLEAHRSQDRLPLAGPPVFRSAGPLQEAVLRAGVGGQLTARQRLGSRGTAAALAQEGVRLWPPP